MRVWRPVARGAPTYSFFTQEYFTTVHSSTGVCGRRPHEEHVGHLGVPADDSVLVDGVVLVEARPRRLHLDLAEGGDMLVAAAYA